MINTFHDKSVKETLAILDSNITGLTQDEVRERVLKFGPNILPESDRPSLLLVFLKQFHSLLVYILLVAAVISLLAGQLIDFYVILVVIVLNAVVGFIHERRAERAVEALKKMIVFSAKVYRDGKLLRVEVKELVPGDIISLEAGDKIPADARLIEERDLSTEEASLTGESLPIDNKSIRRLAKSVELADQKNMVWMGTSVVGGVAKAIVVATGAITAIGQVAKALTEIKTQPTHFEKKTRQLAFQMSIIAIGGALITFLVGAFVRHLELLDIFLFSVASLVSGIPEGLPAVLTIVLAIGARRIASRNAIIRHLPAVETLGVVTVIATDKTGTLTQNLMMVKKILLPENEEITVSGKGWDPQGSFFKKFLPAGQAGKVKEKKIIQPQKHSKLNKLLKIIAVCNNGRIFKKNGHFEVVSEPTEAALFVLAAKAGLKRKEILAINHQLDELPFDSQRKYRAVLTERKQSKQHEICVVGAFEKVVNISNSVLLSNGVAKFSDKIRAEVLYGAEDLAKQGMRVLAIAYKKVSPEIKFISEDLMEDLIFVGTIAIHDPPRPEVKNAIIKAKRAGIRVIMQTGDHKETALAIAKEIHLVSNSVKSEDAVLTEKQLLELSPDQFDEAISRVSIFARMTPTTKLAVVESLQRQGEIVAMTGDGVNDAPAIKKSDIGIAMGIIGTDVSREASEMILSDDNFASIVNAIEEGRIVFNNVRQTSFYLVTTNVAEDMTIIAILLLGLPLPLLPIHILWLNLITDAAPATTLAAEPGHNNELEQLPRSAKEKILSKDVLPFLLLSAGLMMGATIIIFSMFLSEGLEKARTIAFTLMAFFQLFNVLNMRSLKKSVFEIGFFTNRPVIIGLIIAVLLQVIVIYVPLFQKAFRFTPLTLNNWLIIILVSSSVFWLGELYKAIKNRSIRLTS